MTYAVAAKARNRPVLEKAAVSVAPQNINYPNRPQGNMFRKGGMDGKPQFYRCLSFEHLARDCHLPYRRVPAFQGVGKDKGKAGKPIYWADSMVGGNAIGGTQSSETGMQEHAAGDSMNAEPNADQATATAEEIWLSQRWNQEGTFLARGKNDDLRMEANRDAWKTHGKHQPCLVEPNDSFPCIIDSGSSWSVVGVAWAGWWSNSTNKEERGGKQR